MSKIKSVGGPPSKLPIMAVTKAASAASNATDSALSDSASHTAGSGVAAVSAVEHEPLEDLVAQIQTKVAAFAPGLEFSVDQLSGKAVVKVTDTATNDVVWQFPSVAAIQISKELDQFQKGVLINRQV